MQKAELRSAQADVEKCVVHAPFDGTVVEKYVQAYQFVRMGEPLLRLVNSTDLEVEAIVSSQWLKWLKPGTVFSMTVEEVSQTVLGRVDRVVDEVDPISRTVRMIGVLDKTFIKMLPGMSGVLKFEQ
ncbi:MAG: efflux RND transporter periplasmic adaptor subunit [Magnetovibrio sp.]|nr:efflux RND transporter periplasmic adaptor subunit [Magnetovibrio sp.]